MGINEIICMNYKKMHSCIHAATARNFKPKGKRGFHNYGRICRKDRVTIFLNGQIIIVSTSKPHTNHTYSLLIITLSVIGVKMLYFSCWERSWLYLYDHIWEPDLTTVTATIIIPEHYFNITFFRAAKSILEVAALFEFYLCHSMWRNYFIKTFMLVTFLFFHASAEIIFISNLNLRCPDQCAIKSGFHNGLVRNGLKDWVTIFLISRNTTF